MTSDDAYPEPFLSALAQARPRSACDAPAADAQALFARAQCRLQVGRDDDARADLEAALPALGDACRVELAYVDIRQRTDIRGALAAATEVAARADAAGRVLPRALHVQGLALGKLRRTRESADALTRAAALWRRRGDRAAHAQVQDTLGALWSAEGQLEAAIGCFALSLVEKTLSGDRYGLALTLGNLGRLHLRAGRIHDAIACFEADLSIAAELGDERGRGRMLDDLGRAHLALEDLDRADALLRECIDLAVRTGQAGLEVFARKDLAATLLQRSRTERRHELLSEADAQLAAARARLGEGGEPYLHHLLDALRGELLLARGNQEAGIDILRDAAQRFAEAELPDLEIPTLISLARALTAGGFTRTADKCLTRAMSIARRDGYARYLPTIREAVRALDVAPSLLEERNRLDLRPVEARDPDAYRGLQRLGDGAFGEVWRAVDIRQNRVVAVKRLKLERLYDPRTRRTLLASARVEFEAASRLRHPGVARVLAVGVDPEGRTYVVQQFIEGRPLRASMPTDARADPVQGLALIRSIAGALEELHAHGIVHRDLKPENVMLREGTGDPVLIDFGIAYLPTLPDAFGDGAIVGTLRYMSPEQAQGKRVDGLADVYSLGAILFEWLTGTIPVPIHGTFQEAAEDIVRTPPARVSEFRPDVDPALEELVADMLRKKPSGRPAPEIVAARCTEMLARPAR